MFFCTADYSQLGITHISQKEPCMTYVTQSIDFHVSFEQKVGVDGNQHEPHSTLVIFTVPFWFNPEYKLCVKDCFK